MSDKNPAQGCPVEATMSIIGGKWKPLIIFHLKDGKKRFGELHRCIPKVSRHMLTVQLRELETDGIVHREVYAQVPPKVEYWLTEMGRTLDPILDMMLQWGLAYQRGEITAEDGG